MHFTEKEITSLISRFISRKLPKAEWTHQAHLVVAIWYSRNYNFEASLKLVRAAIINHNLSVGTPNSETEGYHETITKFWLLMARTFIKNKSTQSVPELCNEFIASGFTSTNLPLEYYSPDVLFSLEARRIWVEPDLRGVNTLVEAKMEI